MRVLVAGEWIDVLDPWRAPDELRIEVVAWMRLVRLEDLTVRPEKDVRTVIDYARDVGPANVARKALSRLRERETGERWAACGLGRVLEGPGHARGATVAFFAPRQYEGVERVCVPRTFVRPWLEAVPAGYVAKTADEPSGEMIPWADWHRDAGRPLDDVGELMEAVISILRHETWDDATPAAMSPTSIAEFRAAGRTASEPAAAVLFGWGHHARTVIAPNLDGGVELRAIHEIDPVVLDGAPDVILDTSPTFRDGEGWDIVFVSGYHSTHASLAAEALRRGAAVVCEKPVATDRSGVRAIVDAWSDDAAFFPAFHKRYAPTTAWLNEDLSADESDPMAYYAIVHEIGLPHRHWYRWPSSGSRILANGCHWIDHFLFLNDFATVSSFTVERRRFDDIVCDVELENGATFHLILTDHGSDRMGTREHVEVRTRDITATIDDGVYQAEDGRRLIRKARCHKLAPHEAMYRTICQRILRGERGDTLRQMRASADLILAMEEQLQA